MESCNITNTPGRGENWGGGTFTKGTGGATGLRADMDAVDIGEQTGFA